MAEGELNAAKAVNRGILDKSKDSIVKKQIALVGGFKEIFSRLDRSFKALKIEPFFVKEQWDLFEFRYEFFHKHFPDGSFISDDYDHFNVVMYQICFNFDEVMILASREGLDRRVYFEGNRKLADIAAERFSSSRIRVDFVLDTVAPPFDEMSEYPVSFSRVAHIMCELYPSKPKSLEEISMKVALSLGFPLDDMNPSVKEKSVNGMYNYRLSERDDDYPHHLSLKGLTVLKKLQKLMVIEEDFSI